MRKLLTILTPLLFAFSIFAQNMEESNITTLAELDGEPSAFVNQVVNVITGNFCDSQVDLVIPGPRPLTLQRAYSSGNRGEGTLSDSWNFNHFGKVIISSVENRYNVDLYENFGSLRRLDGHKSHHKHKLNQMKISTSFLSNGATNSSTGEISGRTNLRNLKVYYQKKDLLCYSRSGNGDHRYFDKISGTNSYRLSRAEHLNGLETHFGYYKNQIDKITLLGKQDEPLSAINFQFGRKKHHPIVVKANDGRQVIYKFKKRVDNDRVLLSEVIRPNAPKESYFYKRKTQRVYRKERPNNRFIEVDYYKSDKDKVQGHSVDVDGRSDPLYRMVKRLKAPVGTDDTPIVTHEFFYKMKEKRPELTKVYDANGNKTAYYFTKQSRLRKLERYNGRSQLYSIERLYWAKNKSLHATNLMARAFFDQDSVVIFCRKYRYDLKGNVLEDILYGNLTGDDSKPVTIQNNGVVQEDGAEKFVKNFTYNDNNLVISESDNRKTVIYHYHEGTDLVASKLTYVDDVIVLREFHEYDQNAVLIRYVKDDGFHESQEDLTGVTERHIKRVIPRSSHPYGLPEIVEERALDLVTGQEVLLRKTVNCYSLYGHLKEREHYDANNTQVAWEFWEYDDLGNPTFYIDKLGQKTFRKFDENGNLIYEQGPNFEYHKEFVYDFSDRLIREEIICADGAHFIVSHCYDYLGNRIATTDIYGNCTEFVYDAFGRLIHTIYPPNQNGVRAIASVEYDPMGNPVKKVDPLGNCTHGTFTVRGQPVNVEYPDGSLEKKTYNCDGTLRKSIEKNGMITECIYDYQHRLVEKVLTASDGGSLGCTKYTYNAFHLLSETGPDGVIKTYEYDFAGRLVDVRKGKSRLHYVYDSLGRIAEERTYSWEEDYTAKVYEYDQLSRVIEERVEDQAGQVLRVVRYGYDSDGNKSEIINITEAGELVTFTKYNPRKEIVETIDSLGNVTVVYHDYNYRNEAGIVIPYKETIDPKGNVVIQIGDTQGRVVEEVRKNGGGIAIQKRRLEYDLSGNKTRVIEIVITPGHDDREVVNCWEYDTSSREVACIEAFGTSEQKIARTAYNAFGQKEIIIRPDGTEISHTYDSKGRVKRLLSTDIDYQYTYDFNDQIVEIVDAIHQTVTQRSYDDTSRLIEETLGNGLTIHYEYDHQERTTQVMLPDKTAIRWEYGGIDLKAVHRIVNNKIQYSHEYSLYDLTGNLLEVKSPVGKFEYTYDVGGRLIKFLSAQYSIENLVYDEVGNLIEKESNGTLSEYSYDDLYQLTEEKGRFNHSYVNDSLFNRVNKNGMKYRINALNQLLSDSTNDYSYDLNGCLVQKGESRYAYDSLNRLVEVIQGSAKTVYRYDSDNRRLSKTHYRLVEGDWKVRKTSRYLYTGRNEIGTCDEQGKITELRLLGGSKGAEIGGAVAMEFDNQIYFPIHDHNGSVVKLVDRSGTLIEEYHYSAFGEEKRDDCINPWRFSSKRKDSETGLIYFGRRYYDPSVGRWITPDPLGFSAGPNLYAYVNNSPLTNIDLYGLIAHAKRRHTLFCHSVALFGKCLQALGDHLMPIPIVRDVLSLTGHLLHRRTSDQHVSSSKWMHSRNFQTGGYEDGKNTFVVVNGVMNRFFDWVGTVFRLHGELEGANVYSTFNACHGFMTDILECVAQVFGIPTNSEMKLAASLKERIQAVGGPGNGGAVHVFAHSQGGLVLHRALRHLTPEERQMLHVYTFGSAKFISPEGLGEAVNKVNSRDGVPWLLNAGTILKNFFRKEANIDFNRSKGLPLIDHSFEGDLYWRNVNQICRDINSTKGAESLW